MQAIMMVKVFPPNDSFKSRVSLLSLYGTKDPFLEVSDKVLMQFPRANNERFIFAPSILRIP